MYFEYFFDEAIRPIDTRGALCYIIVKLIFLISFGGPVAQWIEQRFPKPRARGSSPLGRTILAVSPQSEG